MTNAKIFDKIIHLIKQGYSVTFYTNPIPYKDSFILKLRKEEYCSTYLIDIEDLLKRPNVEDYLERILKYLEEKIKEMEENHDYFAKEDGVF